MTHKPLPRAAVLQESTTTLLLPRSHWVIEPVAKRAALRTCSLESILLKISLPQLTTGQESKTEPLRQGTALLLYPGREEATQRKQRQVWYHVWWDGRSRWGRPQALALQQPLCSPVVHPASSGLKAQQLCLLPFQHPKLGAPWLRRGCRSSAFSCLLAPGGLLGRMGLPGKSKLGQSRVLHAEPTPNVSSGGTCRVQRGL